MKKIDLDRILTIYGRKPVTEALEDPSIRPIKLHLADSNKSSDIITEIKRLAVKRGIEVKLHDKLSLSRISKNSQQDQGVALDIQMNDFLTLDSFIERQNSKPFQLVALDGITTPQNVGMIIRSVCASNLDGVVIPDKGCAKLDSLVIKASAGTLFKCPIIRCNNLAESLEKLRTQDADICCLSGKADVSLFDYTPKKSCVYVLGNETEGVSTTTNQAATVRLKIPMARGVESLNVAVAASLVAFHASLARSNIRQPG